MIWRFLWLVTRDKNRLKCCVAGDTAIPSPAVKKQETGRNTLFRKPEHQDLRLWPQWHFWALSSQIFGKEMLYPERCDFDNRWLRGCWNSTFWYLFPYSKGWLPYLHKCEFVLSLLQMYFVKKIALDIGHYMKAIHLYLSFRESFSSLPTSSLFPFILLLWHNKKITYFFKLDT